MASDRVAYTQAGRMVSIATSLGQDQFLLDGVQVQERINGLFDIHATAKSQRDNLQAGDLVGSSIDIALQLKDGGTRYWNGFVTDLHEGPMTTRGTRSYALTARPKLWLLSQTSDCRIFQDQTSSQVIETLCSEHGISAVDLRITGNPAPQPYSVQWNETDLAYMLRRMEEDGLFYWFEHAQGQHTFVVADHPWGYRASAEASPRYAQGSTDRDHITDWRRRFSFTPGKRSGSDWNFETMQVPSGTQPSFAQVPGNSAQELFEYPGRFLDNQAGESMMKNRIQATETGFETVDATSTIRTLGPAQTITPQDIANPANAFQGQVITAIAHTIANPSYESGPGLPAYDNAFSVMPATTAATPHRAQPRPKIVGQQIALIAGPSGEEIHTDQYGRVKVWFPWDRRAKKDGSDTCWVRVGQPWAGGTWGHQVIPRVGMEALIAYQDGDPDRPFITALVPDPTNSVPYSLPDNKTRMVFRSNSYKSSGFNEMTFEDATGGERVFSHAQKDHTAKVGNTATNRVDAHQVSSVGGNSSSDVGGNLTHQVGGSMNLTVGGTGLGAQALMAGISGLTGTTGSMLALSGAGPFGATVGQATLGFLSQAGLGGQQGVMGGGGTPRSDAGQQLAASAQQLGASLGSIFPQGGTLNMVAGNYHSLSVGGASAEQVGIAKVVNVGQNSLERVGKLKQVEVGDEVVISVGGTATLVMNKQGQILLNGVEIQTKTQQRTKIQALSVHIN